MVREADLSVKLLLSAPSLISFQRLRVHTRYLSQAREAEPGARHARANRVPATYLGYICMVLYALFLITI
jgi:hypothetical protein